MCTRERYRIEDLVNLDRNQKKTVFFVDGRSDIDEYQKRPQFWRVDRIPCGLCLECRLSKAKEWAHRCMKEAKQWEHNVMLTLTYDDEHVPKSKGIDTKTGEIYDTYTLRKKDHQDFMKRLRKHYANQKIRFFLCGEYGEERGRPHYHVILFNLKVEDMKPYKVSQCEWSKEKNMLFKSKTMDKLWGKGFVDLNEVNFETCRYVAGYVTKKYKGSDSVEHYRERGQIPEYTCMSRKPGIGYDFFEENKEKFMEDKPIWNVTKKGLRKVKSRYFDKLIEKEDPKKFLELKSERKAKQKKMMDSILEKTDIERWEYIENQESKVEIKNKLLKKRSYL